MEGGVPEWEEYKDAMLRSFVACRVLEKEEVGKRKWEEDERERKARRKEIHDNLVRAFHEATAREAANEQEAEKEQEREHEAEKEQEREREAEKEQEREHEAEKEQEREHEAEKEQEKEHEAEKDQEKEQEAEKEQEKDKEAEEEQEKDKEAEKEQEKEESKAWHQLFVIIAEVDYLLNFALQVAAIPDES